MQVGKGERFDSCDNQIKGAREIIGRHASKGWVEVACLRDEAKSGKTLERPEMRRLMEMVAGGVVRRVVIYKLERLLRSTGEWTVFRDFLALHGCQLVGVLDDIDESTPEGRLKNNIVMSVAEYTRLNTNRLTKAKMVEQANEGQWNGGTTPYGYDYNRNTLKLVPMSEEASIVRRIFELIAALQSPEDVARTLNDEGLRTRKRVHRSPDGTTKVVGGSRFRSDWIRRAIQNPIYYGGMRFAGVIYAGQHESIVTKDLWDRANATLAEHTPAAPVLRADRDKNFHLLKGYLFCVHCRRALIPSPAGKRDNQGRPYRYYSCGRVLKERADANCPLGRVSGPAIENLVVAFLGQVTKHPDVVEAALGAGKAMSTDQRNELAQRLRDTDREIEGIAREIANLIAAVAKGGALAEDLEGEAQSRKRKQRTLMVDRERLRQELAALDAPALGASQFIAALERFDVAFAKLSPAEQKELVGLFVRGITVASISDGDGPANKSRTLSLRFELHLPHLLPKGGDQMTFLKHDRAGSCARRVRVEARVVMPKTRNGELGIVTPFKCQLTTRREEVPTKARHPIHRAVEWEKALKAEPNLTARALAARVGVSEPTMSQQLQLTRLCTRVRNALLALDDRRLIWHLSYRRLKPLLALTPAEQCRRFSALRDGLVATFDAPNRKKGSSPRANQTASSS